MIIEHQELVSVLDFIIPGTLVLFDLDNTLIKNKYSLGSPEWVTYFYQHLQKTGLSPEEAHQEALATYLAVNQIATVELVCQTAPKILQTLQKVSQVGVLTAREVALADVTLKHLQTHNLVLSDHWGGNQKFPLTASPKGCFTQGVIFAGGVDKGKCLLEVLERTQNKPNQIVFVDDTMHSLKQVESALKALEIPFVGIRYSKLDTHVSALAPEICEAQLAQFRLEQQHSSNSLF